MKTKNKKQQKRFITKSLPNGYWFSNEHGTTVTVMATRGEWCMVKEEYKKKPYVLPKEFVLAIRNEGMSTSFN